jgi:hypothetical protein
MHKQGREFVWGFWLAVLAAGLLAAAGINLIKVIEGVFS